ncbi:MAG: Crp/Fnr family transcriptional regulator [Betaproteobacteria bacterium]|nr:Crp/Fnr family transcriptional regulator [Betaproteobacteria bacterium]
MPPEQPPSPENHLRTLDIPQILSRLPLFLELTSEQLSHIAAGTREKRLAKGEMLFQKGDPPRGLFIVVFGQIKLAFPSSQGNEKVVSIIGPRQSFGEAVMFMDRPYPVFAESLTDALLLHISKATVFELLERDTTFARSMLAGLSLRLHTLVHDVESYSLRSSTQRVIGYLLQHCELEDQRAAEKIVVLPTSKQVIASRLNLTPETLSRVFHELVEASLITVQGKRITIHDPQRLREFDL